MICVKLWEISCSVIYVDVICSPSHSIICVSLDKSGADLGFCKGGARTLSLILSTTYNIFLKKKNTFHWFSNFHFLRSNDLRKFPNKRRAALWRLLESCSASKVHTSVCCFFGILSRKAFPHTSSGHARLYHSYYQSILNPDFLGTSSSAKFKHRMISIS
jgi:hypothetical protein